MDDQTTIAALEQRVAQLEALVEQLTTASSNPRPHPRVGVEVEGDPLSKPQVTAPTPSIKELSPSVVPTTIDRRRLLGRASTAAVGAVLGGTAAAIASAAPAAAATTTFDQVEITGSGSPALRIGANDPRPLTGAMINGANVGLLAAGATWGIYGAADGVDSAGVVGVALATGSWPLERARTSS